MREAIFELHLLMMAPFYEDAIKAEGRVSFADKDYQREQRAKGELNFWASIVNGNHVSPLSSPHLRSVPTRPPIRPELLRKGDDFMNDIASTGSLSVV